MLQAGKRKGSVELQAVGAASKKAKIPSVASAQSPSGPSEDADLQAVDATQEHAQEKQVMDSTSVEK